MKKLAIAILLMSAGINTNAQDSGSGLPQARCVDCTSDEQLFADMAYLNQLLDVLRSYESRIQTLDPRTLEYLRNYLSATGADDELIKPFLTNPVQIDPITGNTTTGQLPPANPQDITLVDLLPEEDVPYVPPPPSGIQGLGLAYAQEENLSVNRSASVTIVSNGTPRSYGIGGQFTHNGTNFTVNSIVRRLGPDGVERLYVTVTNPAGKNVTIPWSKDG